MIEPASLVWRKTNAIPRKEGEKGYERKFALKTILKFYPKIEPLYQGILHQNILETRFTCIGWSHEKEDNRFRIVLLFQNATIFVFCSCSVLNSIKSNLRQYAINSRPSESVRPVPPWPDQNFPHSIQSKSFIV